MIWMHNTQWFGAMVSKQYRRVSVGKFRKVRAKSKSALDCEDLESQTTNLYLSLGNREPLKVE